MLPTLNTAPPFKAMLIGIKNLRTAADSPTSNISLHDSSPPRGRRATVRPIRSMRAFVSVQMHLIAAFISSESSPRPVRPLISDLPPPRLASAAQIIDRWASLLDGMAAIVPFKADGYIVIDFMSYYLA